jgi:hypothetical protein
MAKVSNKKEEQPEVSPASSEEKSVLVEVLALKNVNTSLYGNIREGHKGKVGFALAEQLEALGEVKVIG